MVLLAALVIGVVAGLRAMTAPAAVSWAARLGWLDLQGTSLAWLGYAGAPWILTVLALGELVADQLPTTPSRTVPVQFGARVVTGRALGRGHRAARTARSSPGSSLGCVGAVIGTLGGRRRARRAGRRLRQRSVPPRSSRTPSPSASRCSLGGAAMTHARRHHHRRGPGRPVARRPPDRRRHDGRRSSSASCSAARASTPAACRPRRSSPAPTPRTSRAAPPTTASSSTAPVARRHGSGQGARRRGVGRLAQRASRSWLRGMDRLHGGRRGTPASRTPTPSASATSC